MRVSGNSFENWYALANAKNKGYKENSIENELKKNGIIQEEEKDKPTKSENQVIIERFNEKQENERIASRLASGEWVTPEERTYLEKNNPELLERAKFFKLTRKRIEQEIRCAKTKEEAKRILADAKAQGIFFININDKTGNNENARVYNNSMDKFSDDIKETGIIKYKPEEAELKKKRKINTLI